MYAEFFGFRELPFNNTPDPRFFYATPDHEEALASLIYAVQERKGFVLLTGEIGAGKTLVTRLMLRHFGTHIAYATIHHAIGGPEDLMESISTELEIPPPPCASPTQLVRVLHDFLLAQFAQNIPVVLVLDEAQNLPTAAFEQLRMIGNLEADDAKLLQIVIVGQPELQRRFSSPELQQLRQRLFRRFHLPALHPEDTEGYIRHRLAVASGENVMPFDEEALGAVHRLSGGVPRLINTICDNVLLSAYSADRKAVDRGFVESVVSQMGIAPAPARPVPADRGVVATEGPGELVGVAARLTAVEHRLAELTCADARDRPIGSEIRIEMERQLQAAVDGAVAQVRREADAVTERLTGWEARMRSAAPDLTGAQAAAVELREAVDVAESALARAVSTTQALESREKRLQRLAETVSQVVRDLRRLVDCAHAGVRGDLRDRATATRGSVQRRAAEVPLPARRDAAAELPSAVCAALDEMRESVAGLRALGCDSGTGGVSGGEERYASSSTERLAHRVDGLLEQMTRAR